MPLEGHWQTQNTPLRKLTRRERRAAAGMLLATVLVLGGLLLATGGDTRPGPAPGCIRASIAGRTGAELIQRCGQEAVSTCRHAQSFGGPAGEAILAACDSAGIKF